MPLLVLLYNILINMYIPAGVLIFLLCQPPSVVYDGDHLFFS